MKQVLSLLFVAAAFIGCTLPKRQPLVLPGFAPELQQIHADAFVIVEPTLPAIPLIETVWDNAKGPYHSPKESQVIGFDQHYSAAFMATPPAIQVALALSDAPLTSSRIVFPFGRMLVNSTETAAVKAFRRAQFLKNSQSPNSGAVLVRFKVDSFHIVESPLNHVNLYAKVSGDYTHPGSTSATPFVVEKAMSKQRLGSILSTHANFIRRLNEIGNRFTEEVVADIFKQIKN